MVEIAKQRGGTVTQCWAHTQAGRRCASAVAAGAVPYCAAHLKAGDGALEKVAHPDARIGFCLVARRALPKGYKVAFWGDRSRCQTVDVDDRCLQYLSGAKRTNPNGVIDPAPHPGSLGQYMNAPSPRELPTARRTRTYFGAHNDGGLVGQAFETTVPLARGAQLAFPYDNEWWRIRGLRRLDAGCGAFPLPRRDPGRRRDAARAREGRRLDALLPILAPFLDEGTCSLVELGCGSSGGLPLALAATRRRFRRAGVVGVASAAATRALLAKACARATFVASAAAVAVVGADVVVAPTKSAAADANAARLARRTLRDGGALVVEGSGDDEIFLAWVRRAARVLGGGRATMHRSAPDCAVYVFERAGGAGGVDVEVRDYD